MKNTPSDEILKMQQLAGIIPLNESDYAKKMAKAPVSGSTGPNTDRILRHSKLATATTRKGAASTLAFPDADNIFMQNVEDGGRTTYQRKLTDGVTMCCPNCNGVEIETDTGYCPVCDEVVDPVIHESSTSEDTEEPQDDWDDEGGIDSDLFSDMDGDMDDDVTKIPAMSRTASDEGDSDIFSLIDTIRSFQDSGLSDADKIYDVERLYDMPKNIIRKIYSRVTGEPIKNEEYAEEDMLVQDEVLQEIQDDGDDQFAGSFDEVGEFDEFDADSEGEFDDFSDEETVLGLDDGPSDDAGYDEDDIGSMLAEIEYMQDSGQSMSTMTYPIEKLEGLVNNDDNRARIKAIYNKVMGIIGESVAGDMSNGYDSGYEEKTTSYNGGNGFPLGHTGSPTREIRYTGKYGDNPIKESASDKRETRALYEKIKKAFGEYQSHCKVDSPEGVDESSTKQKVKLSKFEKEREERKKAYASAKATSNSNAKKKVGDTIEESKLTFALPSGYDWDVKKFAKQVKTKSWVRAHKDELCIYADRLTSAGADRKKVVSGMLGSAYGANIGGQVLALLKPEDFDTIRANLISVCY